MNMILKTVALAISATVLLSACVASRLPPDARGVSFPVREDSYRTDGIVVTPETVRLVRPGLDKDQVRQLLGAPHFTEGLFFVHDWNYLIKLSHNGGWLDCQLQVQFDPHNRVRASYWRNPDCEALAPTASARVNPPAPLAHRTLVALRFPFGRSDIGDLSPADRERLYAFVAQIGARAQQVHSIEVVGHADRLGSPARKHRRSLMRAQTVAKVFVAKGIDPKRIAIIAKSDAESSTNCPPQKLAALMACLAPDRQAVVRVQMTEK